MGNNIYDGQILAEKLSKLNNSQQSIESLSRLCISHRKRAKEIVETWDKLFSSSQKEQRISFLYLANDILQNSRRKGSEFVNEFWKVLPAALRHVYDSDEHGKKVVTRLIDIWEDRKVFGSRGQGLKDEILGKNLLPSSTTQGLKDEIMGKNPLPSSTSNGKSSNPIKIVKRDAHSVRLKLAVGCLPEKILMSLHSVHDEHINEEAALNKCIAVVHQVGKLVEDAENTLAQGMWYGTCFVHDVSPDLDKLFTKAIKCVFLCYSRLQKGYRCHSPMTKKYMSVDVSYHRLSLLYFSFVSYISPFTIPKNVHEVLNHSGWRQAMIIEMQTLKYNGIWELVPLPPRKQTVGCRWVYAIKVGLDDAVDWLKARLVAKGYT
uniref:Regulation of nuclear pre-mRNA domain-containing protein 1B n=1 Tax=Cajanus cajan TaxID=3821 RepID=A0A151SPX9_CAJCA|nr:Regulation of nuclear pre-mRNA domain-containing protein 1B [Cajanus cajan]